MSALYAGFGCRRGCSVEVLEHLLRRSLAAHGLAITALRGIASIALKADEPGLETWPCRWCATTHTNCSPS